VLIVMGGEPFGTALAWPALNSRKITVDRARRSLARRLLRSAP
jgi:hypothetical protein